MVKRQHLTRSQQYEANKLIDAHGVHDTAEDGKNYFTYEDDWSDARVAEELNAPAELVRYLRQEVHGLTRPSRQVPSSPLDYLTLAKRLQVLEEREAEQRFELAKQAALVSQLKVASDKDCERLNIVILYVGDVFKQLGLPPMDFSKAWEPPKDWPKVVSFPPDVGEPPRPWSAAEDAKRPQTDRRNRV